MNWEDIRSKLLTAFAACAILGVVAMFGFLTYENHKSGKEREAREAREKALVTERDGIKPLVAKATAGLAGVSPREIDTRLDGALDWLVRHEKLTGAEALQLSNYDRTRGENHWTHGLAVNSDYALGTVRLMFADESTHLDHERFTETEAREEIARRAKTRS